MADPTAPAVPTDPLAKGFSTSEGQLTVLAVLLGTILEALGGLFAHEALTHVGSVGWSIAPVVAGALLQLCTVFGYTKGRTLVKQQALISGLQAALPLAVQIAEAVADKLTGVSPSVESQLSVGAPVQKANPVVGYPK